MKCPACKEDGQMYGDEMYVCRTNDCRVLYYMRGEP